jgi:hypothetical protein
VRLVTPTAQFAVRPLLRCPTAQHLEVPCLVSAAALASGRSDPTFRAWQARVPRAEGRGRV